MSETPRNEVVLPYVSMHGSTSAMVEYLIAALGERGVKVHRFDLSLTDLGKLAISLVDAATIIIGTPTVHMGAHPGVFCASYLANILRPKLRYASIIGSYGWDSRAIEQISGLIPSLKPNFSGPQTNKSLWRSYLPRHPNARFWLHHPTSVAVDYGPAPRSLKARACSSVGCVSR